MSIILPYIPCQFFGKSRPRIIFSFCRLYKLTYINNILANMINVLCLIHVSVGIYKFACKHDRKNRSNHYNSSYRIAFHFHHHQTCSICNNNIHGYQPQYPIICFRAVFINMTYIYYPCDRQKKSRNYHKWHYSKKYLFYFVFFLDYDKYRRSKKNDQVKICLDISGRFASKILSECHITFHKNSVHIMLHPPESNKKQRRPDSEQPPKTHLQAQSISLTHIIKLL